MRLACGPNASRAATGARSTVWQAQAQLHEAAARHRQYAVVSDLPVIACLVF